MNKYIECILFEFGFTGTHSFIESLFVPKFAVMFIAFSSISAFGDIFFGVSNYMLVLLLILVKVELITGLWASYVRKKKISSKKLQRFLLKIMIYFFFIMVFHQLSKEATDFTMHIYSYMHSFTIMYFVFVHFKSITENYGRITGKTSEFSVILDKLNEKIFGAKKNKNDKNNQQQ